MFKFSAVSQIWKKSIQKLNAWDLSLSTYVCLKSKEFTTSIGKATFLALLVICLRLKIYLFMLKINQFFPLIEKSLHNQSKGSRDTHHQILPQQIPSDN